MPKRAINGGFDIAVQFLVSNELPQGERLIEHFLISGHPDVDAYAGRPDLQRSEAERLADEHRKQVEQPEATTKPAPQNLEAVYKATCYLVQREILVPPQGMA